MSRRADPFSGCPGARRPETHARTARSAGARMEALACAAVTVATSLGGARPHRTHRLQGRLRGQLVDLLHFLEVVDELRQIRVRQALKLGTIQSARNWCAACRPRSARIRPPSRRVPACAHTVWCNLAKSGRTNWSSCQHWRIMTASWSGQAAGIVGRRFSTMTLRSNRHPRAGRQIDRHPVGVLGHTRSQRTRTARETRKRAPCSRRPAGGGRGTAAPA